MITVLIADDEYFIRERLKVMLDYAALGFEITDEANNGRHALDIIEKSRPDIAILDIKMPLLSGIDVARIVREKALPTKCIILTSYEVFEYAQKSLRQGIVDYLLKPVTPKDLTNSLLIAREMLLREHAIRQDHEQLLSKQREENFQNYLLDCNSSEKERQEVEDWLVKNILREENTFLLFKNKTDMQSRQMQKKIRDVLSRCPLFEKKLIFSYGDNSTGILFSQPLTAGVRRGLDGFLADLRGQAEGAVNLGIGSSFASLRLLPESFQDAVQALDYSVFTGDNSAVMAAQASEGISARRIPLTGLRENLLANLRSDNMGKVSEILRAQFRLLEKEYPSPLNLNILVSEILLTSYVFLQEANADNRNIAIWAAKEITEGCTCVDDIRERLLAQLQQVCRSQEGRQSPSQASSIVGQIQLYITEHFSDPRLGLDDISDSIAYSQNYTSTVFKRITGISIVQYITKCRMEAARSLLEQEAGRLTDVYARVGYTDVFYFSKCFKKFWGISPSEYALQYKHARFSQNPDE